MNKLEKVSSPEEIRHLFEIIPVGSILWIEQGGSDKNCLSILKSYSAQIESGRCTVSKGPLNVQVIYLMDITAVAELPVSYLVGAMNGILESSKVFM